MWERSAAMPASPMATSVRPCRQGRPKGSETTTPTSTPHRSRSPSRIARADASESIGSSAMVSLSMLDVSTPALAITRPERVCTMRVRPREATTRTISPSTAASRVASRSSPAGTRRPSALLMIFDVTTTTSPSARPGTAPAISAARSSPTLISGKPGTGSTESTRDLQGCGGEGSSLGRIGHEQRQGDDLHARNDRVDVGGVDQPGIQQPAAFALPGAVELANSLGADLDVHRAKARICHAPHRGAADDRGDADQWRGGRDECVANSRNGKYNADRDDRVGRWQQDYVSCGDGLEHAGARGGFGGSDGDDRFGF